MYFDFEGFSVIRIMALLVTRGTYEKCYMILDEMLQNAVENVLRCNEAASVMHYVDTKVQNNIGRFAVMNCEESLLSLAASDECESIFYSCVFKIKDIHVNRYFEFGNLVGFLNNGAKDLLASNCQIEPSSIFDLAVFNQMDVSEEKKRNTVLSKKEKGRYYFSCSWEILFYAIK